MSKTALVARAHTFVASAMSCGSQYAIASWGQWSAEGQWVLRWKDWIDRGFIRRFSEAHPKLASHLMEDTL